MNSLEEAAYRLKLTQGYLAKAENDATDAQWDDCLATAQEAVENAGKAIIGHFRPIPKTHEVFDPLQHLSQETNVPGSIRVPLEAALDAFHNMGIETRIRATYGDELTHTTPWELITESEAHAGLAKARPAVEVAEQIHDELSKPSPT